jgi:hypothetical protein
MTWSRCGGGALGGIQEVPKRYRLEYSRVERAGFSVCAFLQSACFCLFLAATYSTEP